MNYAHLAALACGMALYQVALLTLPAARRRLKSKGDLLTGRRATVRALRTTIAPSGRHCAAYRATLFRPYDPDAPVQPYVPFWAAWFVPTSWLQGHSFDVGHGEMADRTVYEGGFTEGMALEFEDGTLLEIARGEIQISGSRKPRSTDMLLPHAEALFEERRVLVPRPFAIEEVCLEDGETVEFVGGTILRGGELSTYRVPVLAPTGVPLVIVR